MQAIVSAKNQALNKDNSLFLIDIALQLDDLTWLF